jgi:hypothetical protein
MARTNIKTILSVTIDILALTFLLIYNFVHTGSLLASHVAPALWWVGYLAAAGIELSVVALARQIGRRKHNRQDTSFFYIVLGMVVVVSALANASEGFLARYGKVPTVELMSQIDPFQFLVWMAATALISLIVLSLSEIFGQDLESAEIGGIEKCPHCKFKAEWPTRRYETRRSAQQALRGHAKVHKSKTA